MLTLNRPFRRHPSERCYIRSASLTPLIAGSSRGLQTNYLALSTRALSCTAFVRSRELFLRVLDHTLRNPQLFLY